MRAWVFHGKKDVRLEELPEPEPGPGEVAVRIAYNGICGTDLHEYFHGPLFIPVHEANPVTGHRGPLTLGHEASGTVSALGEGVQDVAIGQQVALEPVIRRPGDEHHYNLGAAFYGVMAPGFLADTAVVQRSAVHSLPSGVSLLEGALTEPLAVAWHAAARTRLTSGQTAVVFGGGPIGLGTALSLRARGVDRLLIVEPSASRRAMLDKLGLSSIDPGADGFAAQLAAFAGTGADAVVDAAGVPDAVAAGIDVLGPHGRMVIVAAHLAPVSIDTNQLLMAERTITGSMGYRDDFPDVLRQQAAGTFPTETWVEVIPFEQLVPRGFDQLDSGRAVKVLVEIGGS
ncbi:zinc-binding dehydrogenase [Amycolatopsis sp. K13G38]|uniref:Zinc-binding dehydrogenase n=1 Tax=Amycolatopsis acididurans TaxID=2724524 RepID=A0ABX1J8L5_9PSEU|nr:zinc-binding dehydrogenase [Amycolatopsis acididurans]NKQ56145.1 zinc-binding dehydrogenase [Amycolatopsis acididurans]